jgi:DNA-binding beta-propeller fold protein YncE
MHGWGRHSIASTHGYASAALTVGAVMLVLLLAPVMAPASASAAGELHVLHSTFGPDGTNSSDFNRPAAIAADQATGAVYVIDQGAGKLYKFGPSGAELPFTGSAPDLQGNSITGLTFPTGTGESQVAIDSDTHVIYVTQGTRLLAFQADGEPADFTAGSGAGSNELPGFSELLGVAVDPEGDIYAADYATNTVSIYSAAGEPITTFPTHEPGNLAVAPTTGDVYVARWHDEVTEYSASSELPVESGTTYTAAVQPIDPGPALAVAVAPVSKDVYVDDGEGDQLHPALVHQYSPDGALIATFPGAEAEEVPFSQGIAVVGGDEEEEIFLSYIGAGNSQVKIFGPRPIVVGPPTFEELSSSDVAAESATFSAALNPNTAQTTYHFEYGLSDCSIIPDPCSPVDLQGTVAAGHEPVAVSAHVAGLVPSTTYHYRLLATNAFGPGASEDLTFVTQASGGPFSLSDGRAWEMVSPARKDGGGVIEPPFYGPTQASATGDTFTFLSLGFIDATPEGSRPPELSQSLARHTAGGWGASEIVPPHEFASPLSLQTEYRLFSPDLGRSVQEPFGSGPLSAEASERTPYLRENFSSPPRWRPLVTGKEGHADVPPGTEFGGNPSIEAYPLVRFQGGSPDLSHLVLSSEVSLTEDGKSVAGALYEWTDGALQPVSILPLGQPTAATLGSLDQSENGTITNAVSADGNYVYWETQARNALYVRDLRDAETVRLDLVAPGGLGEGTPSPVFQGASADGTRAFFTDFQQLTPDSGSGEGKADLYECDLVHPSQTECTLRDVTPAVGGEAAEVLGMTSAIDESGDAVYFVANGVLAPGATPGTCTDDRERSKPSQQCNLYVTHFENEAWHTTFVARLADSDAPDWGFVPAAQHATAGSSELVAAASPSGRYFVFMSSRELTGYDNHDAASGAPDQEVYLYDSVAHSLRCVSCNPTNGGPRGVLANSVGEQKVIDWTETWNGKWLAATLPERNSPAIRGPAYYRPRVVLDDGRVAFDAVDSLAPADANGVADAYQFEPDGVGGCGSEPPGPGMAKVDGGCVSLISSGTSRRSSGVLDSSSSGDDIFFLTAAQLSPADTDSAYDVYDAHVCGSGWQCPTPAPAVPAPCSSGGSCRSAGELAQESGSAATSTFSGNGNVKQHHKKKKHRRKEHHHAKHHMKKTQKHGKKHPSPGSGKRGGAK